MIVNISSFLVFCLDLSQQAFQVIGEESAGRIPITWEVISCSAAGPLGASSGSVASTPPASLPSTPVTSAPAKAPAVAAAVSSPAVFNTNANTNANPNAVNNSTATAARDSSQFKSMLNGVKQESGIANSPLLSSNATIINELQSYVECELSSQNHNCSYGRLLSFVHSAINGSASSASSISSISIQQNIALVITVSALFLTFLAVA